MNNSNSLSLLNEFIKKIFSFKYVYIICTLLFCTLAFLYNRYSPNVFEVRASILLNKNNRSSLLSSNELFRNIDLLQSNTNIENEINCLSSFSLVNATISSLNLEIGYFVEKEDILNKRFDIYLQSPFLVTIDKTHVQTIDTPFYIDILTDSTYRLSVLNKKATFYNYLDNEINGGGNVSVDSIYSFNKTVTNKSFKFSLSLNKQNLLEIEKSRYYFVLYHLDYLTMVYLSNLKIEPISPLASVINISFRGENVQKNITFINKYIDIYFDANLAKKNDAASSTIQFIDSQISEVSDSLNSAESSLRDYRSANKVMDLSFQGQKIYDQMAVLETEKANMLIQKRYYNYVIDYFNKNNESKDLIPPTQMNVADPVMSQLILDMIALNKERSNILNNSQKSLFIGEVENKIKRQREAILENVKNNLNTLNLSLNEIEYRANKFSDEITKLPKTELHLIGMERKFKLNNEIYTYLLQKRAEAQISKASNTSDYEIIEPARYATTSLTSPRTTVNYLIALFLAFALPTSLIFARDFFNDKIRNVNDIENLTKQKVIGVIYSNKNKTESIVQDKPRSSVSESFRTLRTNLLIKHKIGSSNSWLVTSSLPSEGKTFITFNLASSMALLGHKTIIIDCDLRRPSLHEKFKTDNSIGLSSYLTNKALFDDITIKINDNLYFIPSGPVLPNPAEYIDSELFEKLFHYVKTNFNYVLVDSSPVGALSDSFLLMKYVSNTIIVARNGYTKKEMLHEVFNHLKLNNFKNFGIVLNDVNFNKMGYSHYYSKYYSEKL